MTGLDTNVLVRYIMQDDRKQSPIATRCIESLTGESPGYVPVVALVELYWVLDSAYALDRGQLVSAFEGLLRAKEIVVEQAALVWKAVRAFQSSGADFADAVIAVSGGGRRAPPPGRQAPPAARRGPGGGGRAAGAPRTVTFDRRAARDGAMELLQA